MTDTNTRALEQGLHTHPENDLSYGAYLDLDAVLGAQRTLSDAGGTAELLFLIQHQTSELWLKQLHAELVAARSDLRSDHLGRAQKSLSRIKQIQAVLAQQWSILDTMTPTEYLEFRPALGQSSGFQSYQYRAIEFMLGNKNTGMLRFFTDDAAATALLTSALEESSIYDEFCRLLDRRGFDVPDELLTRDVTLAHTKCEALVPTIATIYRSPAEHWDIYELCELLVDVEDHFQTWRFRHLRTVMRTIGTQPGTGGSSGVTFLRKALDLTFFPELYAARGEISS